MPEPLLSLPIFRARNEIRVVSLAALLALCACAGGSDETPKDPPPKLVVADLSGQPLAGLDPEVRTRFNSGDALFDQIFLDSQGLGPVYIRASCASCHSADG